MYAAARRSPAPVVSTGSSTLWAAKAIASLPVKATAPSPASVTTAVSANSARSAPARSTVASPVSRSASRRLLKMACARERSAGGRPANARASSSPHVTKARAPSGTMYSWSRFTATARGALEATSVADERAPGSTVTIARSPPNGMTTVVGVRGAGRVAIQSTPSSARVVRTRSPARSSPSGAATAVETPSRAAPMAVIAPPPGERRSPPANRSSPSAGSDSSPTNVRSRKTGVATTSSVTVVRG